VNARDNYRASVYEDEDLGIAYPVYIRTDADGLDPGPKWVEQLECCDPCCYLVWINGFSTVHQPNAVAHAQRVNQYISQAFAKASGRPGRYCRTVLFSVPLDLCTTSKQHWYCFHDMERVAMDIGRWDLSSFLKSLRRKCPHAGINLVSWSLGGRVLLSALKALPSGTVDTAVLAHAAVPRDAFTPGGEFAASKLTSASRIVVAHSRTDEVLTKMYDVWGLLKKDALGAVGSDVTRSFPAPTIENWDLTDIWGQSHNGVIGGWGSDKVFLSSEDGTVPMAAQHRAGEFWSKVAGMVATDRIACDAANPKRTLEPPRVLSRRESY
jgi:hypothetical protein